MKKYHPNVTAIREFDSAGRSRFYSYFVPDGPPMHSTPVSSRATDMAHKVFRFVSWTRTVDHVSVIWDDEFDFISTEAAVDDTSFERQANLLDLPSRRP
jgi:hypothetical protein